MTTFSSLGLSQPLLDAVTKMGFVEPTPIQEAVIPAVLAEATDLLALAQTGTGKTAAFGLPLLDQIDQSNYSPQALILTPTRELCLQVCTEMERFASQSKKTSLLPVYGGTDIQRQIRALKKGVHIVVATPGRLRDLIRRKAISLDEINYFVLDEADEMLNMGFKEEIDDILEHAPAEKSVWLFSATMPAGIRHLAATYMNDPVEIKTGAVDQTNASIEHLAAFVHRSEQYGALRRFIDYDPDLFGLVFVRTRRGAKEIADLLMADGYRADALHGDLNQNQRDSIMRAFRNRRLRVLVATDVAARGIDVDDITHVFHLNIPDETAFYTHRSGRTGRAGKTGQSIVFVTPRDRSRLTQVSRQLKVDFKTAHIPTGIEIFEQRIQGRVEKIAKSTLPPEIQPMLDDLSVQLGDLSREELVEKIIGFAAGSMLTKYLKAPDLNQSHGGRNAGRSSRRLKGKTKRLFINMGKIDVQRKEELVNFIAEEANIPQTHIGELNMQEKHTFFEVEERAARKIMQAFKHLYLDERPLRVNFDDGPKREGDSPHAKAGKKRHRKGKQKFKHSRRHN